MTVFAAVRYYDEAARRAPGSAVRALKLGNMLIDAGQFARAETVLRRATTLKPDDPLGWGLLGWTLWQEHKTEEARVSLERSIKIDRTYRTCTITLARYCSGPGT